MFRLWHLSLVGLSTLAFAGQPIERFKSADHFTFSQGSSAPRYGNSDSTVTVTLQVTFLGQQVFSNPSSAAETRFNKSAGSLDFTIKLSDFDPTLPPDEVQLTGSDLGSDLMKHTASQVLPGPYHVAGTFNGTQVDVTMSNVQVNCTLFSQGSNTVTLPWINPVLNELCDVQLDDVSSGSTNILKAVPGTVSGWVVSPIFTVKSMKIEVTGIQQAGQVPAHVNAPTSYAVKLGQSMAGTLASLSGFDNDSLKVCKFFVPNQLVDPIQVEAVSQLSAEPLYLSLWSVGHMVTAGSFQQTIELYDYAAGAYSDARIDPVTTTVVPRKLDTTGSTARFLGANREVKARYRIKQTGFSAAIVWCHEQDQFVWISTP